MSNARNSKLIAPRSPEFIMHVHNRLRYTNKKMTYIWDIRDQNWQNKHILKEQIMNMQTAGQF